VTVELDVGNARTLDVLAQYSHELRNSLGTIRNAMRVLGGATAESAARERSRVLVLRQVETMSRLADDILDVSRMSNGRLRLRCSRIDLCAVAANAIQAVEGAMQQREHRLAWSMPGKPIWVSGDEARLEQVFVNLLVNAAKYTPVGGDVGLSLALENDEVVVVVRDSGVGIAAEMLPRVFDLYVQANSASRQDGLGLGLPLVRALVESHGGTVTAASEGIGLGSVFSVRLPALLQR
jgi:two-component system, sensor histidine kinase